METRIDLIVKKLGFTTKQNSQYKNGELKKAAAFVLTKDPYHFPESWSEEWFNKLSSVKGVEALEISGELIAAEVDRIK